MLQNFFKKPKTFWFIAVGIFASYIIVGIGVYVWQSSLVKETKRVEERIVASVLSKKEKIQNEMEKLSMDSVEKFYRFQNNWIDFETIKVSDRIANGMVVKKILNDNVVEFSGQVVVSGKFVYSNTTAAPSYNRICVEPDENSFIKMPKMENKLKSFCFSNIEIAKNRFGPSGASGSAIVVMDNYILTKDLFDEAELIKTVEIIKNR